MYISYKCLLKVEKKESIINGKEIRYLEFNDGDNLNINKLIKFINLLT